VLKNQETRVADLCGAVLQPCSCLVLVSGVSHVSCCPAVAFDAHVESLETVDVWPCILTVLSDVRVGYRFTYPPVIV
ncbi:hypothetical protein, partial [Xylella fastidiosa]|uniref:hypothetical protein n=1 Tax=Xylella fastidiosa TaxID=2371 RepID=UPI001EEB5BD3